MQVYAMLMITNNFIKPRIGKLILNIWLEITVQSFTVDFWTATFFKLTLGSDCLELRYWTVNFKNHPDSVKLHKRQLLSSLSIKHNALHMLCIILTPNLFQNPNKAEIFESSFIWEWGLSQFNPPSYIKKN